MLGLERRYRKALVLGYPDRVSLQVAVGHDVRGDDDEQFVVLGGEGIIHHGLIEARDDAETRDAGHRADIAAGDFSSDYGGFAILKADAAFIFLIGNNRHAVCALASQ